MLTADLFTSCNPIPRPSLYDKLAEELILKGIMFVGAGVGLYIALMILGKT
jgi:hypothetical protein